MKKLSGWLLGSAAALTMSQVMAAEGAHWGYEGEAAPEHWGELAPEFASCSLGKNQSPVNIAGEVKAAVPKLTFSYTSQATEVLNNGHTIQASFAPGSWVKLGGHAYELKQAHFHAPSENEIHGKAFPMEGHLVHQDKNGQLAVVAVMFVPGKAQTAITRIWDQMPETAGEKHEFSGKLSAAELLPKNHAYYYFSGSLTTPPCSEGVSWIVLKNPVQAGKAQFEHFSHTLHHPNNRPVQSLNARVVIN